MQAVAAGALGAYREAVGRAFLSKADVDLPDEALGALGETRAAFAGPAAERLTERLAEYIGRVPTSVTYLPRGTFHAVFRVETDEGDLFYARTSVPAIPWPALDFAVDDWIAGEVPRRGVPVAPVRHVDLSRTRLPFDVEVTEAVPGEPLAPGPGSVADDAVRALGAVVARLHDLPCRGFGPLDPASLEPASPPAGLHPSWSDYLLLRLDEHLAHCRGEGALSGEEVEAVRRAFRDAGPLLARAPSALLHGDLGNHNVLVRGGAIVALLDWEDSLAGDPVFDVACWATFVGNHERLESFLAGYRTSDTPPEDFELRYWLYYLRIMLAKTVHRSRFGYARSDRIPARERLRPALEALETRQLRRLLRCVSS